MINYAKQNENRAAERHFGSPLTEEERFVGKKKKKRGTITSSM